MVGEEIISDSSKCALEKYKCHPSIIKIQEQDFMLTTFNFLPISILDMHYEICNLDTSKAYQKDNISPKLLKDNNDICSIVLSSDINRCIHNGNFPNNLKNADITPTFKKGDHLSKCNYRPVSILPTLLKVYEKILYQQIYEYFNHIFSKYLCGFRKHHSTQHCLLFMLETLKKALDNGLCTGIVLTDLSKAFDSISHNLLIAKLNAYGFSFQSLNIISDYLIGRKQRTKINDKFSMWQDIIYGVPQGPVLGPLLFNIYINDLFFFTDTFNIANYADDCSSYAFSDSIDHIINMLESHSHTLIEWYENSYLKPNPDKWHLILSAAGNDMNIIIGNKYIYNSDCEKMLGVHFDNKLIFNSHVTKLCKKAGQKLHALSRISSFMSIKQKKNIMNTFIFSHFSYCPLIWMCHSRSLNSQINRIHERALRIVYSDNISSFDELLKMSNSVRVHRNIQLLAVEIYKALNKLSPSLTTELFQIKKKQSMTFVKVIYLFPEMLKLCIMARKVYRT